MVDRFERFSYAIAVISRCWHKIAGDEMAKYGLKGTHAAYLTSMYKYKDGITAANLCEVCGRDKSDVSRMISILEKKGLVKKQGQNHYRALLCLTEEGEKAAAQVAEIARIAVERAGEGISDEERAVFYSSLERIADNLKDISENGLS